MDKTYDNLYLEVMGKVVELDQIDFNEAHQWKLSQLGGWDYYRDKIGKWARLQDIERMNDSLNILLYSLEYKQYQKEMKGIFNE